MGVGQGCVTSKLAWNKTRVLVTCRAFNKGFHLRVSGQKEGCCTEQSDRTVVRQV